VRACAALLLLLTFPVPASAETTERDLQLFVLNWRQAWTSKDLDAFMSFYGPEFRSGGLDRQGWRQQKRRGFEAPGPISVQISEPEITIASSLATVSFVQWYDSSKLSDIGEKTLTVRLGDPKIVAETWRALASSGDSEKWDLNPANLIASTTTADPAPDPEPAPDVVAAVAPALEEEPLARESSAESARTRELFPEVVEQMEPATLGEAQASASGSDTNVTPATEPDRYDYLLLATKKTSTMQKEMSEAADNGYWYAGVMGGETSFGGSEVVVVMARADTDAEAEYKYKLLATSKTSQGGGRHPRAQARRRVPRVPVQAPRDE